MKNLIVHIEQIKDKALFQDFEENAEAFPVLAQMVQNRECEFIEPLKINVKAYRIRELFEVEGNFQTRVRQSCSRCLKRFDMSINSKFALTYTRELPDVDETSDAQEIEWKAEQIGLIYFRGEEIDLRDGIQEQVVMAFPLRALCAETCRGLCPNCGADLNQTDCRCKHSFSASAFAVLENLKLSKK